MRLLKRFAIGFILAVMICCFLIYQFYLTLPSQFEIKQAMQLQSMAVSSQVFDRSGEWIGKFSIKNRYLISYQELPDHLIYSFTSAEDKDFFSHFGINLFAIARAFYINLKRGKVVQGASTITQQLAKSFFLTNQRTLQRKIKEALLAFKIESTFDKKTILEIYLNKIFLGNHSYGVGAAAKAYFNKSIQNLNAGESALLASLPKAPSYFAPHKHYERAIRRQHLILHRMHANGHIDKVDLNHWIKNPPKVQKNPIHSGDQGYFLDMVKSEVFKKFSFDKNKINGLNIFTSLDADFQKKLLTKIKHLNLSLRSYEKPYSPGLEMALLSVNHNTGEIVAISGGGEYSQTQFNRALYTKRAIGQLVVPLALLYPLELGYQLNMPLSQNGESVLSILSSQKSSHLNSVIQLMGKGSLKEFLFELGLPAFEHRLLHSLDLLQVTPIQISNAFASIFNGGNKIFPFTIKGIESISTNPIYQKSPIRTLPIIRRETAFMMSYSIRILDSIKKFSASNLGVRYFSLSRGLKNAWVVGSLGSLTHVVWFGGEYGKTNIAANHKEAKSLLIRVLDAIFKSQGKSYQERKEGNQNLSISYGRHTHKGQSLTIPMTHF